MVVTYEDGTTQTVVTDPSTWKAYTDGPNRYADNFQGVTYDASKEANIAGWTTTSLHQREAQQVGCRPTSSRSRRELNPEIIARQDQPGPRGRAADRRAGAHHPQRGLHDLHLRHGRQHGRRPVRSPSRRAAAGRRRGHLPLRRDDLPGQQRLPEHDVARWRPAQPDHGPVLEHLRPERHLPSRRGRSHPDRLLPRRDGPGPLQGLGRRREPRRGHHAELHVPRLPVHRDHGPAPHHGAAARERRGHRPVVDRHPGGHLRGDHQRRQLHRQAGQPVLQERPAQPARQLLLAADRLPPAQRAHGLDR